ncbi:MAG: biotin-(acetyl-CoA carboxylase) ligase [Planctomycetota bacterium]|jgi:biotin-(acetyl-CoA carboxylase) ligase
MTMAGGLAALDCVRELGVHAARLKWPNDLVVALETDAEAERVGHPAQPALPGAAHGLSTWERAAKLAGVLIEARSDCAGSVVGIGLNVLQRQFPSELTQERPVTSLSLLGIGTQMRDVERELLHQLASRLQQTLEDPRGVARDFLRATQLLDVPVEVEVAGVTHRGVLEEIDEHGYLHLATSGERISLQLAHVGRLLPLL